MQLIGIRYRAWVGATAMILRTYVAQETMCLEPSGGGLWNAARGGEGIPRLWCVSKGYQQFSS